MFHKSGSKNVLRLNRSFPIFEGYNHISRNFLNQIIEAKRKHFILIIQINKCRHHKMKKKKSEDSSINSITDKHTNYEIESTKLLWSKQFYFAP